MGRMHIVLVEPSGEVLFEGDSVLAATSRGHEVDVEVEVQDADDAGCPPTMRSAESGFFPSTKPRRAA